MKYFFGEDDVFAMKSRPVRGAWIEISAAARPACIDGSRPVRGAWIEMHLPVTKSMLSWVAPREGRVD